MHTITTCLVMLAGYLLGSVSFARILTRLKDPDVDLTQLDMPIGGTGRRGEILSGVGANTAGILLGAKGGLAVAALDMLKGALPTLLAHILWPGTPLRYVAALSAVIGHNWPIYYRFKGGSGWSTAMGALLTIDPLAATVLPLGISIISLVFTGQPIVGDLLWPWLLIPWLPWRTGEPASLWWALGLNVVITLAVIPEIRSFFHYRQLGLLEPYMEAVRQGSPRRRGLQKLANRLFIFKELVERKEAQRSWLISLTGEGSSRVPPDRAGNKALGAFRLARVKHRTPRSWVLTWDAHTAWLAGEEAPSRVRQELAERLDAGRRYAVRSSANVEDGRRYSQAGRFDTVLDVTGVEGLLDAIHTVWRSAEALDRQPVQGSQGDAPVHMAVLIQEMVQPKFSGVAFSCNPVTGLDEIVIEAVSGTGEALVQDGVEPMRWTWKWGAWIERPDEQREPPGLPEESLAAVVRGVQSVARSWGGAVDLEWCWDGKAVYWLQVRDITGLDGIEIYSNHMSKEFLPGVIMPLVWSINAPLVNGAWARFLTEIIGPNDLDPHKMARTFLHRAYFAMAPFKIVFQRLGMHPESLELIMGINLGGDERPFLKPGPAIVRALPRLARFALGKIGYGRRAQRFLADAPRVWRDYGPDKAAGLDKRGLVVAIELLSDLASRAAYHDIVTPMSMQLWDRLLRKALAARGIAYEQVDMSATGDASDRWDPAPALAELHRQWEALPGPTRERILAEPRDRPGGTDTQAFWAGVDRLVARFGHLSDSGNDFAVVPWREQPDLVLKMIAGYRLPPPRPQRAWSDLALPSWWRWLVAPVYRQAVRFHALRDGISGWYTYAYGLLRPYVMALAEQLVAEGGLARSDDIFFLSWTEVRELAEDPQRAGQMAERIRSQRQSVAEARDLMPPTLVFGCEAVVTRASQGRRMTGAPTSGGRYTGPVCKITGLAEMTKMQRGDVLVIPYSDVGLTPLFGLAGAVISASGGVLSHSSIVAREYGLPAVVSVHGAMDLADGAMVSVDGYLGEVVLVQQKGEKGKTSA